MSEYLYKPSNGYCYERAKAWGDQAKMFNRIIWSLSVLASVLVLFSLAMGGSVGWSGLFLALIASTLWNNRRSNRNAEARRIAWLKLAVAETPEEIREANRVLFP